MHSCEKYWECSQCSLELAVVKLHRGSVSLGPGITRCSKERVSFFFCKCSFYRWADMHTKWAGMCTKNSIFLKNGPICIPNTRYFLRMGRYVHQYSIFLKDGPICIPNTRYFLWMGRYAWICIPNTRHHRYPISGHAWIISIMTSQYESWIMTSQHRYRKMLVSDRFEKLVSAQPYCFYGESLKIPFTKLDVAENESIKHGGDWNYVCIVLL